MAESEKDNYTVRKRLCKLMIELTEKELTNVVGGCGSHHEHEHHHRDNDDDRDFDGRRRGDDDNERHHGRRDRDFDPCACLHLRIGR